MTLFLIMAALSVLVTLPAVLLIPKARQSPAFDRVLWGATGVLAFLGAWGIPTYIAADSPLNGLVIAQVAILPMLIGAAVGAFSINGLLWVMDRFSQSSTEENPALDAMNANEEENVEQTPTDPQ